MLTDAQLAQALGCPLARAAAWGPHLRAAMQQNNIATPRRVKHFIGQIGHESRGLADLEENLNYRAARLLEVFPRYFSKETAARCAGNPKAIACVVYGGRNGNRPGTDDGWTYRGRSPIHLTFLDNYREMERLTGLPLLEHPEIALQAREGAIIAATWWRANGLNALADRDEVLAVSRRVNFGTTRTNRIPNGYSDRTARTRRVGQLLGV